MNLQMFLLEEGKVKSSSLKYYLKWIDMYKQQQCETGRFYDSISSTLQDWQINQAMNAVHLYNIFKSDTKKPGNTENGEWWQKILRETKEEIRLHHLSYRTEKSYLAWLNRFKLFCQKRDIQEIETKALKAFLTEISVTRRISISTQKQAFNALLFTFRNVLNQTVDDLEGVVGPLQCSNHDDLYPCSSKE